MRFLVTAASQALRSAEITIGMEWRVFIATDSAHAPFDLWSFLGLSSVEPEIRDDLYIVSNDAVGIKARGGRQVEIKVRSQRKLRGAEHWTKYAVSADSIEKLDIRRVLEQVARKILPPDDFATAMTIASQPIRFLNIKKKVQKQHVRSLSVEQTDIQCHLPQSNTVFSYRTFCVEGGTAKSIYDFVEKIGLVKQVGATALVNQFHKDTDTDKDTMARVALGYPGFVKQIADRLSAC